MAAVRAPAAILAVVTGGSGAAARLGRPPVTKPVAGRAGVVVAPRKSPAAVASRAGTTLAGLRPLGPFSAAREGRRV